MIYYKMQPNKTVLERFIKSHIKHYSTLLKNNYNHIYRFINSLDGDSFPEKCYRYINKDEIIKNKCGICPISGKKTKFFRFNGGYRKYFSKKEMMMDINFIKNRTNQTKNTLLSKYNVNCPSKLWFVKNKIKEKRNSGSYKNVVLKRKHTNKLLYNNENYVNVSKIKETKFLKYHNESYNNRDGMIKTLLSRYNSKIHPNTLKRFKENLNNKKIGFGSKNYKNTIYNKYNVNNVSKLDFVKHKKNIKIKLNMIENMFNGDRFKDIVTPLFNSNEYLGTDYKYKYSFRCNSCGTEFKDNIYSGHIPRCPKCFPFTKSHVENEIIDFLKSVLPKNTDILHNDRTQIAPLEIDIYIPSKQFGIEYDGIYFHCEGVGKKDRNYHINKTNLAKNKGIKLIHIFEDEWRDKKGIVKNRLCHLLKINPPITTPINRFFESITTENNKSIYARKCNIKEIDTYAATDFINKYHIQGYGNCAIRLGAYFNGELVACMTFGKRRVAMGMKKYNIKNYENEYELIRFCVGKKNVVGIAGKLFNYFINNYKPVKIISYADRRWSEESAFYSKIGMICTELCKPNYFYFKINDVLDKPTTWRKWHRFNFRKDQLPKKLAIFDPNLTEWENMQNNGYDRIWDCGNWKFEWNIKK